MDIEKLSRYTLLSTSSGHNALETAEVPEGLGIEIQDEEMNQELAVGQEGHEDNPLERAHANLQSRIGILDQVSQAMDFASAGNMRLYWLVIAEIGGEAGRINAIADLRASIERQRAWEDDTGELEAILSEIEGAGQVAENPHLVNANRYLEVVHPSQEAQGITITDAIRNEWRIISLIVIVLSTHLFLMLFNS